MFNRTIARRRGTTILETIVSVAAFSGVAGFIVALSITSARQTNRTLKTLPQETQSYRTMDRLRGQLLPAASNSMNLVNNGRTMNFFHAANNQEASYQFDPQTKKLVYDPDVNTNGDETVIGEYEDVIFDTKNFGRYVSITIKEKGSDSKNKDIVMSRQEWIRVRN